MLNREVRAVSGERGHAEILGPPLRTLAESLDVRDIFARILEAARTVVPHDSLMMGVMNPDGANVRVEALSGELRDPAPVALGFAALIR